MGGDEIKPSHGPTHFFTRISSSSGKTIVVSPVYIRVGLKPPRMPEKDQNPRIISC